MRKLLYERGFIKKPKIYDLIKRFGEDAYWGFAGKHAGMDEYLGDMQLLS